MTDCTVGYCSLTLIQSQIVSVLIVGLSYVLPDT